MTLHPSDVIEILSAEQYLVLSGKTHQPEGNNRYYWKQLHVTAWPTSE